MSSQPSSSQSLFTIVIIIVLAVVEVYLITAGQNYT